jgi:hypothetical protein
MAANKDDGKPGEPVVPCTEAPALRYRDPAVKTTGPTKGSEGYTSPGHVAHFLPDREVNLGRLNKSLIDVFGEPALRGTRMELEIDKEYWIQVCSDPWSGNVYRYNFARVARPDESIINPEFIATRQK